MRNNSKIKVNSNRSFGIVFFFVFLIISLWPLTNENPLRVWSVFVAIFFLILGLMNSKLLTPLNKLWLKFGIFLGSIVSPIIMGIVYFLVVTPTGLFMRFLGKDLLKKDKVKNVSTYWIKRDKQKSSMKRQF